MNEKMLRIVIAGASGTIGSCLVPFLRKLGYEVVILRRKESEEVFWCPEKGILSIAQLEGVDVIINLAGHPLIGSRWNAAVMTKIRESRIMATRVLSEAICTLKKPPQLFISSSAVGYYGHHEEENSTEESAPGDGFLGTLCKEWEAEAKKAEAAGTRVILLRTGIVLSSQGGALAYMLPLFRLGLGGKLGSGKQYMSWIAIDDFIAAIHFIIMNPQLAGAVNMTSPCPVTNKEFALALAKVLHRPAIFSVPAWTARLFLGKCADEALLIGAKVYPKKLLAAGFSFSYSELSSALLHIIMQKKNCVPY